MCLILLTTFLLILSAVQGDYGDIYQMSRNISVSNFDGRVILTEIERSKLKFTHHGINWRTLPVFLPFIGGWENLKLIFVFFLSKGNMCYYVTSHFIIWVKFCKDIFFQTTWAAPTSAAEDASLSGIVTLTPLITRLAAAAWPGWPS